jgi:8-oxo-dGTP diphosphatase
MDETQDPVTYAFGNRLRIRVCGILVENEQLLLVNHRGIGTGGSFWSPPGGGVQFGESLPEALIREFREETGLVVRVGRFMFVNEFIRHPLHAVELFFEVQRISGDVITGTEPEISRPILEAVEFLSWPAIAALPREQQHNLFHQCRSLAEVLSLKGYLHHIFR